MRTLLPLTITAALAVAPLAAQDIKLGVTYICSAEHIYVENCNIRDTSDTSTCMVGHPDRPSRNGIMVYTNETRGALKKLLPTCTQPSAKEVAAADAVHKKQQDIYNANVERANRQMQPPARPAQGVTFGQPQKPKTPEQRAMTRCITAGRLPATCTGNSLLGAFGQMISQVLPSAAQEPPPGPQMAGVFQGAGNWRLDFTADGVLVNCSFLSPDERRYAINFRNNLALLTIDMTPKPLVLTVRADGTITGPGPVTIDGVVATGGGGGGPDYQYRDANGMRISNAQAAHSGGPIYDNGGNRVSGPIPDAGGGPSFARRTAVCPAQNLSSKGAGVGVQTMQTDLLKTMFGGDKGPPTPPGIRMRGIFAASTGFSAQFFPESVVLGCGPDAARAYPYSVVADGTRAFIKVDAPDHPLTLGFRPDGSLDPGSGPYQVHGRVVTGQNADSDFTFAPLEQTCNLGVLAATKEIPSAGGVAAATATAAAASTPGAPNGRGTLATPAAPLGNAVLTIVSGFPAQPGVPNPLAGHPFVLLRDTYADALAKGGIAVPAGMSAYKFLGVTCGPGRTPDCQKILAVIDANAISAIRADASGRGVLPGVPPGTYHLMISTRVNNQSLVWDQPVQLKAGANALTLDRGNASLMN